MGFCFFFCRGRYSLDCVETHRAHSAGRSGVLLKHRYFKSHWSYEKVKDYARNMLDSTKRYFVCGLPYQLSIAENLLDNEAVADEMSEAGLMLDHVHRNVFEKISIELLETPKALGTTT